MQKESTIKLGKSSNKGKVYRSRAEIMASILEAAGPGEHFTRIMYKSHCSTLPLKTHIKELLRIGLLAYDSESKLYNCTLLGARYLSIFYRFKEAQEVGWLD